MDEYSVRGMQEESELDIDRVQHTETAQLIPEDNSKEIGETHKHVETRDEKENKLPEVVEREEAKQSALRENVSTISGIFASVAVTAVVSVAVAFSDAPVVNISQFDVGSNYVEYVADVVNETGDSLVISINNDYQIIEKTIESGQIKEVVSDLKPDTKYTFTVKATGGIKRSYISKSFRTLQSQTEYQAKVTNVLTSRKNNDNTLYVKFEVSDIYSYFSNYKLVIKDNSGIAGEIPITDIAAEVPINLDKYCESEYTMQLTADTVMPSDKSQNIKNKVLYSATIKN